MRYVIVSLILTGIMVFSIVDIALIDNSRVRHLPKPFWILLVILLTLVGSILWFTLGRERAEPRHHGRYRDAPQGPRPAPALGPDDDPDFLDRLARDKAREDRIKELERKLAELDDDNKPTE